MEIELLADHAESIPQLAARYRSQWEPYYGVDGPGDALSDLESYMAQPHWIWMSQPGWRCLGKVEFVNEEQGSIYSKDI